MGSDGCEWNVSSMTSLRWLRALLARAQKGLRPSRLRRLERRLGRLPPDFVARRYRALHPDTHVLSEAEAAEHYLVHGRAET